MLFSNRLLFKVNNNKLIMSSKTMEKSMENTQGKKGSVSADPIYVKRALTDEIHLQPNQLNYPNISDIILQNLKNKVEGRCISDGYIKPESVEILSRNSGIMENHDFSGSVTYTIKYKADICVPYVGQVIECIVDTHDDTNSVCYIGDEETSPMEIYLFRDHYIGNADYVNLQSGDKILIKIMKTQIEYGKKILASGLFSKKVSQ